MSIWKLSLALLAITPFALAIPTCRDAARQASASCEIKNLVNAVSMYRMEYGQLPIAVKGGTDIEVETTWPLIDILSGYDVHGMNTEKKVFFEGSSNKGGCGGGVVIDPDTGRRELRDPWGNPYRIIFDIDGDEQTALPNTGELIPRRLLAYSSGGDLESREDDITSW